jgi:hypothetical protein
MVTVSNLRRLERLEEKSAVPDMQADVLSVQDPAPRRQPTTTVTLPWVGPLGLAASPLQMFVALAPIATALLDPFQAAIGVGCFVGFELIGTSFAARLVGLLIGIAR